MGLQDVDWIPADIAAAAILDFRASHVPTTRTAHLAHPRPVSWRSIATFVSGQFSVPLVPYSEWLAKLEGYRSKHELHVADSNPQDNMPHGLHALHLMSFYRDVAGRARSGPIALGMVNLEISEALKASPTLASPELRRLKMQDAQTWLAYWRRMGIFS